MVRTPAVAGHFYSGSKEELRRDIEALIDTKAKKENALGAVSPHAGYMYSGSVAGAVLSSIKPKNTYIIIGPNHTGLGDPMAIDSSASWRTPLGDVAIDKRLADRIIENCEYVTYDNTAHEAEHSVEVQVPFLQVLQHDFTIVPIVASSGNLSIYRSIGKAIARSVAELKIENDVTIIASSDMTHYESRDSAKKKDSAAIEAVLKLDEEMLLHKVSELDITMCGYVPVSIMITAAKELGAKRSRLVKYCTSGDVTGDYDSVVGYAGIIIER